MSDATRRALIGAAVAALLFVVVVLVAPGACNEETAGDGDAGTTPTATTTAKPTASVAPSASAPQRVDIPTFEVLQDASKVVLSGSTTSGKFEARFAKLTGQLQQNGQQIAGSSLSLTIDSASLTSADEALATRLKSAELLEADRYPETTFVSTRIQADDESDAGVRYELAGNLTWHGVLKHLSFPVEITRDDDALTLVGSFEIDRDDFGVAGTEDAKPEIRSKMKLSLELKMKRKQAP